MVSGAQNWQTVEGEPANIEEPAVPVALAFSCRLFAGHKPLATIPRPQVRRERTALRQRKVAGASFLLPSILMHIARSPLV